MAESLQSLQPLLQNDSFSSHHSSCCELLLLEILEYFLALLFAFVGEEKSAMSFEILNRWRGTSVMR